MYVFYWIKTIASPRFNMFLNHQPDGSKTNFTSQFILTLNNDLLCIYTDLKKDSKDFSNNINSKEIQCNHLYIHNLLVSVRS